MSSELHQLHRIFQATSRGGATSSIGAESSRAMDQRGPLTFAYYVTGHGFGHATRVCAVAKCLINAGHVVHIVTGAPSSIFTSEIPVPERLKLRPVVLDCGAVQSDALTVDCEASLLKYESLPDVVEREAEWIRENNVDLVVVDVAPMACTAARQAGVPAVVTSNFSWDYIYAEYVNRVGGRFRDLVDNIARDYGEAALLLRYPGATPMPAFRQVEDVPLVVRLAQRSRAEVREQYGIPADAKVVCFNFGGQRADWKLKSSFLPPGWVCIVCTALPMPMLPDGFIKPPIGSYTPDLIEASDVMLGKIGYGTTSEAVAHGKPFVFVRRHFFNEQFWLLRLLESHGLPVELSFTDFFNGEWHAALEEAYSRRPAAQRPSPPPRSSSNDGARIVAERLIEVAMNGDANNTVPPHSGSTIVSGFVMRSGRMASTPAQSMPVTGSVSPGWNRADDGLLKFEKELADCGFVVGTEGSSLTRNDALRLSADFLRTLRLVLWPDTATSGGGEGTTAATVPSAALRAARTLFSSKCVLACTNGNEGTVGKIIVTRAPGRLDLMGGIADYSGSLVLQMPIREACFVALQRQMRRHGVGDGSPPVFRVVSLQASDVRIGSAPQSEPTLTTSRSPIAEILLSRFFTKPTDNSDWVPVSYDTARATLAAEGSTQWSACVVGPLLVLAHELPSEVAKAFVGKLMTGGDIAVLVRSWVPEGKGVSSSAAIEVSALMALVRAFELEEVFLGRPSELAKLAQKVENEVVGAPCGIMDQMASLLGKQDKLMALLCQPCEILGYVRVPPSLSVWGLDSGIRHCVGGADYGDVRAATFVGFSLALKAIAEKSSIAGGIACEKLTNRGRYLVELASPSEFAALYESILPDSITGDEAVKMLREGASSGDSNDCAHAHGDPLTKIKPTKNYGVRKATAHPVHEHFRVKAFASTLGLLDGSEVAPPQLANAANVLGELMLQSHASYGALGLGSDGTDRLVELVKTKDPHLVGAKITGGGSGGTVAVLGLAGSAAENALKEVTTQYQKEYGHSPHLFRGSSPGAFEFGHLNLTFIHQ